jgi:threonine synthase
LFAHRGRHQAQPYAFRATEAEHHRSFARDRKPDGPFALRLIRESGGWAEDISDPEIIDAIKLLAQSEGIFAETAGGVTAGVAAKLIQQGRIRSDETTVVCITGNGLKTTDAIAADFPASEAIAPRLEAFEALLAQQLEETVRV